MAVKLSDLLAPGRVAFVLTEVQDGIVGDAAPWPALKDAADKVGLVANAARIADAARARKAPVIHCTAENLPDMFGQNVNGRLFAQGRKMRANLADPKLDAPCPATWKDGDLLMPRYHGLSAMTGSPLDTVLRNEGITTLVIAGVSLSFGVMSLTMDAVNRAYQVILPTDAVAGFPEEYARMALENTYSMLATLAPTDEILAAWA